MREGSPSDENKYSNIRIFKLNGPTGLQLVLAMARNPCLGTRHSHQIGSKCSKTAINDLNDALKDPTALKALPALRASTVLKVEPTLKAAASLKAAAALKAVAALKAAATLKAPTALTCLKTLTE